MTLNDLLTGRGYDPKQVIVMRHRPKEPKLNKVLPWLAADRPDVFNAYQQTQNEKAEAALQTVKYLASFLGRAPGKATFVGLYAVNGWTPVATADLVQRPPVAELVGLGMEGLSGEAVRPTHLWFDLTLVGSFYPDWKGRLIIRWPPPERSWWRRAHRAEDGMSVLAIREESAFDRAMPAWDELTLTWEELGVIPARWRDAVREWRGVYYIFDASDGKGYVGSAAGGENLLGRWVGYAASGHGGNVLLKGRDPKHFRFSILQRVSPDMDPADVVRLEGTWKKRLHTRTPFGLNEN